MIDMAMLEYFRQKFEQHENSNEELSLEQINERVHDLHIAYHNICNYTGGTLPLGMLSSVSAPFEGFSFDLVTR